MFDRIDDCGSDGLVCLFFGLVLVEKKGIELFDGTTSMFEILRIQSVIL
jgi:hypothetical protein